MEIDEFTDDFIELIKEYKKPDYLTPTSLGVDTGFYIDIPTTKADGRDAEELK
jgi:hypothetical protein